MVILIISIFLSAISIRQIGVLMFRIQDEQFTRVPMIFYRYRFILPFYSFILIPIVIINGYQINGIAGSVISIIGVPIITPFINRVSITTIDRFFYNRRFDAPTGQLLLFGFLLILFTIYNIFIGF